MERVSALVIQAVNFNQRLGSSGKRSIFGIAAIIIVHIREAQFVGCLVLNNCAPCPAFRYPLSAMRLLVQAVFWSL
jgi:hypothetical protein